HAPTSRLSTLSLHDALPIMAAFWLGWVTPTGTKAFRRVEMTCGLPTAYPIRNTARACALEKVRTSTRLSYFLVAASPSTAVESVLNSQYASSRTISTSEGTCAMKASNSSLLMLGPVGLLGEHNRINR